MGGVAIFLSLAFFFPQSGHAQLAKGKSKFLGCAMDLSHASFASYWNQVTPGNAGKWGSVEGAMDSYNWTPLDNVYNFAVANSFRFKEHCLVWGSQQPGWITSVDSATQRAQVQEWIQLVNTMYGRASFVDVVNEPFHAPPPYMNALGGAGSTGWDWVITAFTWARLSSFPGVKLLLNEYNVLQSNSATDNYLALIDTLKLRNLIDGIGIQGHYFEFKGSGYTYDINTLKSNLNRLGALGLPIYISEFSINEPVDSVQLANYQIYFSMFWENPAVKGITLWGYVQGDVWTAEPNVYLVRSDGSERPALQWLRHYLAIPLRPTLVSPLGTGGVQRNAVLTWHKSETATSYRIQVSTNGVFIPTAADTTVSDTIVQLSPLAANKIHYWHVSALNDSGPSSYSDMGYFTTGDQIVAVEEAESHPASFTLSQNFPNPFNPTTAISYHLPAGQAGLSAASEVRLVVYDILGREVAVLVNERKAPGRYEVTFDASGLASGVYFYRLEAGGFVSVKNMTLVK